MHWRTLCWLVIVGYTRAPDCVNVMSLLCMHNIHIYIHTVAITIPSRVAIYVSHKRARAVPLSLSLCRYIQYILFSSHHPSVSARRDFHSKINPKIFLILIVVYVFFFLFHHLSLYTASGC